MSVYGDITPRTAAYAVDTMLERAQPELCMARFAVLTTVPKGKTKVVKWARYGRLAASTTALTEGVTPAGSNIYKTDVTGTLDQYGQWTGLTDVIIDVHEDPVLKEYSEAMGETAGQSQELIVYNAIKAGTAVSYSNGTTRVGLTAVLNSTQARRAIRTLKQQDTKPLTTMLSASDGVGTVPIPRCFVCFCHPNVEMDLQNTSNFATGYRRVQDYGTFKPISDAEIGSFENIRFMASTLYTPFANAGGTLGTNLGGSASDVYASIVVGKNAYGTVNLAGSGSGLVPIVFNPKVSDSDKLGQRGHVAYKMWALAVILNDAFMVRMEHTVAA
jgi:N4-gp56 family major capsid protein